jgi:hypothetical protein
VLAASIIKAIALMIEAAGTSEMSVNFYQTTRRNIPEDCHIRNFVPLEKFPFSKVFKRLVNGKHAFYLRIFCYCNFRKYRSLPVLYFKQIIKLGVLISLIRVVGLQLLGGRVCFS